MKKILAVLLALITVFSLTGCMATNVAKPQKVTEPASPEKISYKNYEDTLEGLCQYMADLGYAYALPSSNDESAAAIKMDAGVIGADAGYKFNYKSGSNTVTVEYYSYTDFDCDDYKQAKKEGKITIEIDDTMEDVVVDAVLSKNGKYMMILNLAKENEEYGKAITEAFQGFYA